ncbi:hypothetical protein DMC01_04690 [Campylobacter troglodytis]|nr:hypothetical protein DMC01_04690 [Campylobacter troglodytis]
MDLALFVLKFKALNSRLFTKETKNKNFEFFKAQCLKTFQFKPKIRALNSSSKPFRLFIKCFFKSLLNSL